MPTCIPNLLKRFPNHHYEEQYSLHEFIPVKFGSKTRQLAMQPGTLAPLNRKDTIAVQSIVGSLLYHGQSLDASILPALNAISTQQNAPTKKVMEKCHRLLDYVATYPNPILCFYAIDMALTAESDSAYLALSKACSRAAGYFYLHNKPLLNLILLSIALSLLNASYLDMLHLLP